MLKSLVQLFAEKFLTSKKEWVGSQGLFSNPNPGTTFFVNHAQAQLYTPPSDGWITFGGNRPSVNVGITGKLGTCCVNSKGDLLHVATGGSNPEISKLMFYPTP